MKKNWAFLKRFNMAGDQAQFYQLLNTLLATDNDTRSQAEVSDCDFLCFNYNISMIDPGNRVIVAEI